MKKLFLTFFIVLLLIGMVSSAQFDNTKKIKENGKRGYPNIEIKNLFGFGATLWDGELTENTDNCGASCSAEQTIILGKDGSLIDEIKFETVRGDGSRIEQSINDYKIYIKTNIKTIKVNDYELQCKETGIHPQNGTAKIKCNDVKIGDHDEYTYDLIPYTLGDEVSAGIYYIILKGYKNPKKTVDWIIKTNGIWLNEWALWGGDYERVQIGAQTGGTGGSYSGYSGYEIIINSSKNFVLYSVENSLYTLFNVKICKTYTLVGGCSGSDLIATISPSGFPYYNLTNPLILNASETYMILIGGSNAQRAEITNANIPFNTSYFQVSAYFNPDTGVRSPTGTAGFDIVALWGTSESEIILNLPANNTNSTASVTFNCSVEMAVANITNISLYTNESGTWEMKNQTLGLTGVVNNSQWTRTMTEGNYFWTCYACDGDGDCAFASTNRTLTIDTTPPTVSVQSPPSNSLSGELGASEELNVTFTDDLLDQCWYDYNGTNISIGSCTSGIMNYTTFILEDENYNMTIYGNDSIGNILSYYFEWTYLILVNSETYNKQTTEGNSEDFGLDVTIDGYRITSGNLVYNKTSYSSSLINPSEYNYVISKNIKSPNLDTTQNMSFFWRLTLENGTAYNLTAKNQTVYPITLDNCSTNTLVVFNFTMRDEDSQRILVGTTDNTTMEININILDYTNNIPVLNFSQMFNQTNPMAVCISAINNSKYRTDVQIRHYSDDHVKEYYYMQNFTLQNSSIPQNIDLYDLLTTQSQEFLVTWKDDYFIPEGNVLIHITRNYIDEGVFKTVEIAKTDETGQTIVHLILGDVTYTIYVYKEGVLQATYENVIAYCDNVATGDCKLNLNSFTSTTQIEDFSRYKNIDYSITWDRDTKTITVSYSTIDGSSAVMFLNATKFDRFGNDTVCSDTLISSSGTLNCIIPDSYGNVTVIAELYKDDLLVVKSIYSVAEDVSSLIGKDYIIFLAIMIMTIPLMLITSTIGVVIGVIFGLIASSLLFISEGSLLSAGGSLMWLIIAGIIIIYKLSRRGG